VSEPAPWRCPECRAWIAPHVSEHRCDPPQAGVTAIPFTPGPADSTGTSISVATLPGTVTVSMPGSVVKQELLRIVQDGMLKSAASNWTLPRRAA
jgi:hypothetical protein